jgi:hypothetical protein
MTLPFSSGAAEKQVNRIKTLKRQMFGRAGVDLLRKRILLARWPACRPTAVTIRQPWTKSDPEPEPRTHPGRMKVTVGWSVDGGHSPVLAAGTRPRSQPRMRYLLSLEGQDFSVVDEAVGHCCGDGVIAEDLSPANSTSAKYGESFDSSPERSQRLPTSWTCRPPRREISRHENLATCTPTRAPSQTRCPP